MTFSAIKHITYAAAGGFAAGSCAALALYGNMTQRAAGAAYPYFRYTGIAIGVTAAVARAVDEVFKAIGWTTDVGMRLFAAHIVTGIVVAPAVLLIVGDPVHVGKAVAVALTVASFAVNVIVK